MRPPGGILIPLVLAGAVALSGTATALDRPGATSVEIDSGVIASLRRGRSAREAGRWSDARSAFNDALARADAAPVPAAVRAEILGEIGLCALAQKNHREAAERLAESLSDRSALTEALQRRFEEGRRQAEKHIYRLYLGVNPPDAQVFLDGEPIGPRAGTYQLFLNPGSHTVRARLIGFGHSEQNFDASAGERSSMSLTLKPLPSAPMPRSAPPVQAGRPTETGAAPMLRIAGVVFTATAATVGATALVWSAVRKGDFDERAADLRRSGWTDDAACLRSDAPSECAGYHDEEEQRVTLSRIGTMSLFAAGAVGAVTLASFALASREPVRRGEVHIVPMVGQHAGLLIHGVW